MHRWIGVLGGSVLFGVGSLFYGAPLRWVGSIHVSHIIGIFFLFLFWFGALIGWGRWVVSHFKFPNRPAWLTPIIGTFLMMAFISLLFLSPAPSLSLKVILAKAWLFLGYLFFLPKQGLPSWHPSKDWFLQHWLLLVTSLGCLLLFLLLSIPHPFWDSMWYHMHASRFWYHNNAIRFNPVSVVMSQASLWEYLFLWSHILLAKPGDYGLIAAHIFCQWVHLVLGFFLSCWILGTFLRRIFSLEQSHWLALLILFCFTSYGIHYAILAPKPDWGVIAWYLGAFVLLMWDDDRQPIHVLLAGLLLGACFGAKLSYGFAIVLIPFFFLIDYRSWKRSSQTILYFAIGFCILGLPNSIRNILWTGNPVFPAMNQIFQSSALGPSWLAGIKAFDGGVPFKALGLSYKWKLLLPAFKWYAYAFFLLPFGRFFFGTLTKQEWKLWSFTATTLFVFLLNSGAKAEIRLIGGTFVLFQVCVLLFYAKLLTRWLTHKIWRTAIISVFFCYQFFFPKMFDVPTFQLKERTRILMGQSSIQHMMLLIPGVNYVHFIKKNLPSKEKLFILSDTKLYYLSDRPAVRIWDNPTLDRALVKARSFKEMIAILRSHGGRYLADSIDTIDTYYNRPIMRYIISNLRHHPHAIIYNHDLNWIVDLHKIKFPTHKKQNLPTHKKQKPRNP